MSSEIAYAPDHGVPALSRAQLREIFSRMRFISPVEEFVPLAWQIYSRDKPQAPGFG